MMSDDDMRTMEEACESSKSDEELGTSESVELVAPIVAIAPRISVQEEYQVEVSASPAFQSLDEVRNGTNQAGRHGL